MIKYRLMLIMSIVLFGISYAQEEINNTEAIEDEKEFIEEILPKIEDKKEEESKFIKYIMKTWDIDKDNQQGTFKLSTFKPNYFMPFRFSTPFNRQPTNSNDSRGVAEYKEYQNVEAKFQVSLKSKIAQDVLGRGDIWVGFTQSSYWQIYNGDLSRPFREINYEPEIMFVMPLNWSVKGLKIRMASLSLNHQSNGKEQVLSRSWNRVILFGLVEYKNFILSVTRWWRFTEKSQDDDNADLMSFMGRGEIALASYWDKNVVRIMHRNNMNFHHNRSYTELSWIFPISGSLRGVFQASNGYGDTLVEYNHKQTSIGLGLVFLDF